jgi:hypothetical protein
VASVKAHIPWVARNGHEGEYEEKEAGSAAAREKTALRELDRQPRASEPEKH